MIFFLPAEGRKCCAAGVGAADEEWEAGVVWLAKCASAMSNKRAISSTGFNGGPPCGTKAVFIRSIRSLNADIEAALLNVSCKVKRGPPPLGFFAWGAAIASAMHNKNRKFSTAQRVAFTVYSVGKRAALDEKRLFECRLFCRALPGARPFIRGLHV